MGPVEELEHLGPDGLEGDDDEHGVGQKGEDAVEDVSPLKELLLDDLPEVRLALGVVVEEAESVQEDDGVDPATDPSVVADLALEADAEDVAVEGDGAGGSDEEKGRVPLGQEAELFAEGLEAAAPEASPVVDVGVEVEPVEEDEEDDGEDLDVREVQSADGTLSKVREVPFSLGCNGVEGLVYHWHFITTSGRTAVWLFNGYNVVHLETVIKDHLVFNPAAHWRRLDV
mmetsp:Transcript_27069/g.45429  ORF Transcript_27069/g.45429 Transcript_27069/m.45429 type:complete len:229 (+) Transcript_27069:651-1337(+)